MHGGSHGLHHKYHYGNRRSLERKGKKKKTLNCQLESKRSVKEKKVEAEMNMRLGKGQSKRNRPLAEQTREKGNNKQTE